MRHRITDWLAGFNMDHRLTAHAAVVLSSVPDHVLSDVMTGVRFCDYDSRPGGMIEVPVAAPTRGSAGRAVVLKRSLAGRSDAFARWLIAHEIAHAHLRNGGRWDGDDPETAADALAKDWGFERPTAWG